MAQRCPNCESSTQANYKPKELLKPLFFPERSFEDLTRNVFFIKPLEEEYSHKNRWSSLDARPPQWLYLDILE